MVVRWCETCGERVLAETNESNGFTCCTTCGKILDEHTFSADTTFTKNAATGASVPDGHFVPESGIAPGVIRAARGGRLYGAQLDSHERTLYKGKQEIMQVADRLGVRPREDVVDAAHRLYKLAVQRNFTRGRRTNLVAGACLYIICRQESRPYMLIDFSDVLQTNVYVLGGVFLQLCRLLRLEQHPLMQKPIDPSLFIHRFADKLNLGKRMHAVANTALRLVASMKRDWMQTGRRPNGICGAALWVAAQIHGFSPSKRDVVAVVHVGEATLKKRLSEFENTPSAALSIEEFDTQARTFELEEEANRTRQALPTSSMSVLSCVHKDSEDTPHFAHGMCRSCYIDYVRVSGGSVGGSDPPAFLRAEAQRKGDNQLMLPAASDGLEDDKLALEFNTALEKDLADLLQSDKNASQPSKSHEREKPTASGQYVARTARRELADADFVKRAEDALRVLVGSRWAEVICLPFTGDMAKSSVSKRHLSELHPKYLSFKDESEYIARIDKTVLHFLIAADCFDDSAIEHLAQYSPHDVKSLLQTEFKPPKHGDAIAIEANRAANMATGVVDTLSDVDDDEIDSYIHNDDEVTLRRMVWSEMNKDYLEGQASKESALPSSAPKKKRRRPSAVMPSGVSPAEAAHQALSKKRGSSKINYEALKNLFKTPDANEPTKSRDEDSHSNATENRAGEANVPPRSRRANLPSSAVGIDSQPQTRGMEQRGVASTRPSRLKSLNSGKLKK
jgi:transcription factor IIIB subunit 2